MTRRFGRKRVSGVGGVGGSTLFFCHLKHFSVSFDGVNGIIFLSGFC